MGLQYHFGKANVVADALSRKVYCNTLTLKELLPALHEEFQRLILGVVEHGYLTTLAMHPTLEDQIKAAQQSSKEVRLIKKNIKNGIAKCFSEDDHGVVWFG